MARMVPASFPHDLAKAPRLQGEAAVYDALQETLDDDWTVFYDRPIKGSRRRIDFVAVNAQRGVLAIEVKGGLVHDKRGAFRQRIANGARRKKIDPFRQLRLGLDDLWVAAGITRDDVPVHEAIWLPGIGQGGLRWQPSDHILTRECCSSAFLTDIIDRVLPRRGGEAKVAAIEQLIATLK